MGSVTLRKLKIGEGLPKICTPIVGQSSYEVVEQAKRIIGLPVDLVEWRCDWYGEDDSCENIQETLRVLRDLLAEKPLLFTFRTATEGGEKDVSKERYIQLNRWAVDSGCVDLIDVELFLGDEVLESLVSYAHENGVKVIASNHDFKKTPSKEELIYRMQKMQELGADILKVAVMPREEADVQILLDATKQMTEKYAAVPVVTMSMSELGKRSRIEGEIYGSSITFGSVGKASAPGQIEVQALAEKLREVHLRK